MYLNKSYCNIFEMPRLMLCNDFKMNGDYTSETTDFVRKPFCFIKGGHKYSDTLPRASTAILLTCMVVQIVLNGCWIANCHVCERAEVLASLFWSNSAICHIIGLERRPLRSAITRK